MGALASATSVAWDILMPCSEISLLSSEAFYVAVDLTELNKDGDIKFYCIGLTEARSRSSWQISCSLMEVIRFCCRQKYDSCKLTLTIPCLQLSLDECIQTFLTYLHILIPCRNIFSPDMIVVIRFQYK